MVFSRVAPARASFGIACEPLPWVRIHPLRSLSLIIKGYRVIFIPLYTLAYTQTVLTGLPLGPYRPQPHPWKGGEQSLGCDAGGGFTGVTTFGGSGVTVRSVVLASRLVHAGIATSMASQRIMCIDPRTLLRLPIGLYLQILDCRFSLRRSHFLFKTLVTCERTFGAGKTSPRNKD